MVKRPRRSRADGRNDGRWILDESTGRWLFWPTSKAKAAKSRKDKPRVKSGSR